MKVFPDETELHDAMKEGDDSFVEYRIQDLYEGMLQEFDPTAALQLLDNGNFQQLRTILGRLAAAQAANEDFVFLEGEQRKPSST